jgi:hypothetical protein
MAMKSAAVCLFVGVGLTDCSRAPESDGSRSVLTWCSDDGDIRVEVLVRGTLARNYSRLVVQRRGRRFVRLMDDDVPVATVRPVRYGQWLLVANNEYIIGGFDMDSNVIYGENEPRKTGSASAARRCGR